MLAKRLLFALLLAGSVFGLQAFSDAVAFDKTFCDGDELFYVRTWNVTPIIINSDFGASYTAVNDSLAVIQRVKVEGDVVTENSTCVEYVFSRYGRKTVWNESDCSELYYKGIGNAFKVGDALVLQQNYSWSEPSTVGSFDVKGDPETVVYNVSRSFEGFENISTPAGEFNALKISYSYAYTTRDPPPQGTYVPRAVITHNTTGFEYYSRDGLLLKNVYAMVLTRSAQETDVYKQKSVKVLANYSRGSQCVKEKISVTLPLTCEITVDSANANEGKLLALVQPIPAINAFNAVKGSVSYNFDGGEQETSPLSFQGGQATSIIQFEKSSTIKIKAQFSGEDGTEYTSEEYAFQIEKEKKQETPPAENASNASIFTTQNNSIATQEAEQPKKQSTCLLGAMLFSIPIVLIVSRWWK